MGPPWLECQPGSGQFPLLPPPVSPSLRLPSSTLPGGSYSRLEEATHPAQQSLSWGGCWHWPRVLFFPFCTDRLLQSQSPKLGAGQALEEESCFGASRASARGGAPRSSLALGQQQGVASLCISTSRKVGIHGIEAPIRLRQQLRGGSFENTSGA